MTLFKIYNIEVKTSYSIIFILIFSMIFNYFYKLLILIAVVFLHELSHCFMCIYYGIQVKEIKLFVFGGVAKFLGDIEGNSKQEIAIALAGPLLNFILILISFAVLRLGNKPWQENMEFFITVNLSIGLFNLMPMLPLDGGRVFRGLLAPYLGIKKATYMVIRLGYILCILLFSIGIYLTFVYNIEYAFLSALAVYIGLSNAKEKSRVNLIFAKNLVLNKKSLFYEGTMEAKNIIAMEFIEIRKILEEFTLEKYYIITIVDTKGKVIGSISESEVIDAIFKYENTTTLGELLRM
ncbi:M50 family metallopeptidase [Alkaliphilus oremlandii]|uniref:Peptidase M50 n=1 Tax=Alkaliphilus oremlandii (strain OhILAs) TaxID=350688 RepID=A8MHL5_ALKOO|nr:M50 family metallopeptidase [Alkaliphilus oremlandii]ABW19297.1 peptidase M50 [Alkaliphilus oremlandii OhILAs]